MAGGRTNSKRHEDRRWMRRRWRKLGRGQVRKGSVCEHVDSGKNKGWPWSTIGKGKREGGLSTNGLEEGMTVSTVLR